MIFMSINHHHHEMLFMTITYKKSINLFKKIKILTIVNQLFMLIQLKNSNNMILNKKEAYYLHIRQQTKLELIKKARHDILKTIQLDEQITHIFKSNLDIQINHEILQNMELISTELLQRYQHLFINLYLKSTQNLKFAALCTQLHSIFPHNFFQLTLKYFTQKIMNQVEKHLDVQLMKAFIEYWIAFLKRAQLIEIKNIEIIKNIFTFWWKNIQRKSQYYQITTIFLQSILKIDPQVFHDYFINTFSTLVLFPSKSLLRMVRFILINSYTDNLATCSLIILGNQRFSQMVNDSLQKQYKKQALMLLLQIVNFREWDKILQKNINDIVQKLLKFIMLCIQQDWAIYVLTNIALDQYNELEPIFAQIDFPLIIKSFTYKNIKNGLKFLFLILQNYDNEKTWNSITRDIRFNEEIQNLNGQLDYDLFQHWVYIVYKHSRKEQPSNQLILNLVKAKDKIKISQETQQYIEQLKKSLPIYEL